MVIDGHNFQDEELKQNIQVGDYFIYYNIFKDDKYWILYQFKGFADGPTVPKHFLMCECIGSTSKHKGNVNCVSGKIYRLSVKDARVGYRTFLFRNYNILLKKILGEPTNGYA
jgi:hypothetical protein